jgi:hypothetical protein
MPCGSMQCPFFGAFDALTIDDADGETGFAFELLAALQMMDAIQRAVPATQAEVIVQRAARRQVQDSGRTLAGASTLLRLKKIAGN